MYRKGSHMIFSKESISNVFQKAHNLINSTIEKEVESYILNANASEYAEYLEAKHKLEIPELHFDQVYVDHYEDDIPAEDFPRDFHVFSGKKYKKQIIQYFIPCSGDISLLAYFPHNTIVVGSRENFEIKEDSIVTEFINFVNDVEEIRRKYQREVDGIRSKYNYLIQDITAFNSGLKNYIQLSFRERKEKLLTTNKLLMSLGVPLKKKENVPATFSVPKPQLREKIVVKPIVHDKSFEPEPTLDNENYKKILKLINDVGKNFERMPSVYKGKGEEDLRDHILMVLDPNFELGSASGETFNKTGKTDIQLRYNSSVIFIAECKFWSGAKNYLSTIDQLLGYLTWRDTKASVIVFVRQKDFSSILDKVETQTSKHPNYLSFVGKADENWLNYRFHINGDRNREVQLAVQVYNIPTE